MYYQCPARTLAPGSPALASHPPTIYLREEPLRDAVNGWIGELFDRLVEAQPAARSGSDGAARRRLEEAEAKIRTFQDAIAAGIDPGAVAESINQAQADRAVAQAESTNVGEPAGLSEAEFYVMIDSLGDIGAALADSEPGKLAQLYRDLALDLRFDHEKEAGDLTASPRVNNVCVRGGA
ncbi:hypothetical protein [Streptomyces sp. AA4]|uniref:hypothetical protein n=1 Tax=Streptomyces sp. AA4 TaxID=591158 RepID=UPI0001B54AFC|nr:hypothetical protein [Streptomyces sp. AA4]